ncbi:MAG: hypothetical protein M1814_004784 [Vezdaea aestivalis]|nr:MAG: hypothetical protein M1814_004784 [Vezdaea aestivalis]
MSALSRIDKLSLSNGSGGTFRSFKVAGEECVSAEVPRSMLEGFSTPGTVYAQSVCFWQPADLDQVRSTLFKTIKGSSPRRGLGPFRKMPPELMAMILCQLDLRSGLCFSQVSRAARALISGVPDYRLLGQHGMSSLMTSFRLKLAPHVEVGALYKEMLAENCRFCGKFGGFVFLPTVTRCCMDCVEKEISFSFETVTKLVRLTGIPRAQLMRTLPYARTIAGSYSIPRTYPASVSLRNWIVAKEHADALLGSLGSNYTVPEGKKWPDKAWRYMTSTVLPHYHPATDTIDFGVECICEKTLRESTASKSYRPVPRCLYSREGFLKHASECDLIQKKLLSWLQVSLP